ncbi:helix-turn-helix domain-containing protein [Mucilaginibacter sp. BT774]|uniref:AraC family transcriptional regulator n=1 Tax=Mucilaginibacter sp. BT774 TaxID=3062276 RepID=UPI0026755E83|nr:helix-turn-helix domain-containing protein [Mucilaginibacter sp. BT774]MDO3626941.1 helix-turn-helix domain-containing protein [Mucilaginibacter sp. BT774]
MVEIFDNIRKIYTFTDACPELAEHIEFFSESSVEFTQKYIGNSNFSVKMFPSWTPTFYINLGAPYLIAVGQRQHCINVDQDILILRDSIVERFNTPSDNIFTVKFYPGGLEAVLGISQLKCVNRRVDLDAILPAKLLSQIKKPITFAERCELMQDYLLASFKERQQKDYYLRFVRDCISNYGVSDMQMSIGEMAERMFVTSKTINRYFNRVVGISPKNYFSVVRARIALTYYVNHKTDFTPFDFGYYDMSHFYKEVVRFTGKKLIEHVAA